ncbi:response regulator transcription factor [Paenibacillus aquistagni]|uniref:response regulator transcription factor n=1 Tax=Paenibacillus aquistagni TaxID=1852522 RepID=UPI00145BF67E|nr:response regulator transcription factor [Paenibacillus aquistagni]NMM54954.1 response regulator transcription factor [Paenibacillus aquistagni]
MTRLLIVDDDREIANLIRIYIDNEGYECEVAYDGEEALQLLRNNHYDLVVLDIMMPKVDGFVVTRVIRESQAIPILMLSAKTEDMDKILGLMTGADDYMTKPFNPLELMARVKSLLRRTYQLNDRLRSEGHRQVDHVLSLGELEINKELHTVKVAGTAVHLTSIEFDILTTLAESPGRVFPAEDLYERVWKEPFQGAHNTIAAHISKLRDKIHRVGQPLIQTVWGVGYKIDVD